jgi:hypothetical protein
VVFRTIVHELLNQRIKPLRHPSRSSAARRIGQSFRQRPVVTSLKAFDPAINRSRRHPQPISYLIGSISIAQPQQRLRTLYYPHITGQPHNVRYSSVISVGKINRCHR